MIVVIDDDLTILTLLKELLRDYQVQTLTEGNRFLHNIPNIGRIRAFIIDFNLGHSSGIDYARYLRSIGITKPPIIFISSDEPVGRMRAAAEIENSRFLNKDKLLNLPELLKLMLSQTTDAEGK